MNTQGALIKTYAKQLKFPTLLRYEEVLRLAQDQGWGYEQFLAELLFHILSNRNDLNIQCEQVLKCYRDHI